MFSSLSSFSLSHLLSPFFRPKHHPPPNINITYHSGSFFLMGCDPAGSVVAFVVVVVVIVVVVVTMLKGRGGYG